MIIQDEIQRTDLPIPDQPRTGLIPHGGKVEAGCGPIAKATVTLWSAGPGTAQKLAETQTKDDGSFEFEGAGGKYDDGVLYLIAKGGVPKVAGDKGPNPAITLMATL